MQNPHRPHQAYHLVTLQVVLREHGRLPCVCIYPAINSSSRKFFSWRGVEIHACGLRPLKASNENGVEI